jgi:hypothetical protein
VHSIGHNACETRINSQPTKGKVKKEMGRALMPSLLRLSKWTAKQVPSLGRKCNTRKADPTIGNVQR